MNTNLRGRSALITGGGTGIGAAIAEQLGAEGVRLMIAGRRIEPLRDTAERLRGAGIEVHTHAADVSSGSACKALAHAAIDAFGAVDILINNAGVSSHGRRIEDCDEATFDTVMGANLKSAFLLSAAILPHMAGRSSGTIVMLSSMSGIRHFPNEALYGLTKHGMNDLAEFISVEYAASNIRCFSVCPALVRTDMGLGLAPTDQGALLEPEDVAAWVVFALKQPGSQILTQPIVIDNSRDPWSSAG